MPIFHKETPIFFDRYCKNVFLFCLDKANSVLVISQQLSWGDTLSLGQHSHGESHWHKLFKQLLPGWRLYAVRKEPGHMKIFV